MTITQAYRNLLNEELPHAVHNDREHRKYLLRAEELLNKRKRSAAEEQYLELLTILTRITQYSLGSVGSHARESVGSARRRLE
jgi:hypothetical protein